MISCEDYERTLRGAGEIPVYAGVLSQRGGFSIGGGMRNFLGSVLPIIKTTVKKAVKRNLHGQIIDKIFRGNSFYDSLVGEESPTPPKKKKKTVTQKKKIRVVKRGRQPIPSRIPRADIFQ